MCDDATDVEVSSPERITTFRADVHAPYLVIPRRAGSRDDASDGRAPEPAD